MLRSRALPNSWYLGGPTSQPQKKPLKREHERNGRFARPACWGRTEGLLLPFLQTDTNNAQAHIHIHTQTYLRHPFAHSLTLSTHSNTPMWWTNSREGTLPWRWSWWPDQSLDGYQGQLCFALVNKLFGNSQGCSGVACLVTGQFVCMHNTSKDPEVMGFLVLPPNPPSLS